MNKMFDKLKRLVTPEMVATRYTKTPNRGFIQCPFHSDKTASMRVGGRHLPQKFKCMGGCHWVGDIVDFTAKLFNLTQYQAVQKLVEDFRADVNLAPPTKEELVIQRKREQQKQIYLKWKAEWLHKTNPEYFSNVEIVKKLAPFFWNDPINPYKRLLPSDEVVMVFEDKELVIKENITGDKIKNFKFESFISVAEMPQFDQFFNALCYLKKNELPNENECQREYIKYVDINKKK